MRSNQIDLIAAAHLPKEVGTFYPIQDSNRTYSTAATAIPEIVTDVGAGVRSLFGGSMPSYGGVVTGIGLASGANMPLGYMYATNNYVAIERGLANGNKKAVRNGCLGLSKGVSMVAFGAATVAFRTVGLANMASSTNNLTSAAAVTEMAFNVTGIFFMTVSFCNLVMRALDTFALKWKMWMDPMNRINSEVAEFTVMARKLLAVPTDESIRREIGNLKGPLSKEDKELLKKWIEEVKDSLDGDIRKGLESALAKLNSSNWENDKELKSLLAAVRIGSRKEEKLLVHFSGDAEKLDEMRSDVKALLVEINAKIAIWGASIGINNLADLLNAVSDENHIHHVAAIRYLRNAKNLNHLKVNGKTIGDVVNAMHTTLTGTIMSKLVPAFLAYTFGLTLWILGLVAKTGSVLATTLIPWGWFFIAVYTFYLDGKDFIENKDKIRTEEEKRVLLTVYAIAMIAAIAGIAMAVLSGGGLPLALAIVLFMGYASLFEVILKKDKENEMGVYVPASYSCDENWRKKAV